MASPSRIDLDSLLQPISDDLPAGPDVREDMSPTSLYQTIKQERNQARAAERQSIHDGSSQEAELHWQRIAELAPDIIQSHAKDLEVATWYAEAMLRRHGFGGLRDAFLVIQGLIDQYWEQLHPMPDEYGIETRLSCLSGLSGEGVEGVLIAPIRRADLTDSYDPGPFSLWQYRQAIDMKNTADDRTRNAKIAAAGFSLEDIERSVANSESTFFVNLRDDITQCIEIYTSIGRKLDELCGLDDSPPTKSVIEVLDDCMGTINHIAKDKFPLAEAEPEPTDAEEAEPSSDGSVTRKVARGPIASREDAFKQLIEIADFFKKTEPHSPVSYVLQKAVKWGNMPLGELISELITDDTSRERFSELTGVNCGEKN